MIATEIPLYKQPKIEESSNLLDQKSNMQLHPSLLQKENRVDNMVFY
jgi:hypothetical protein